MKPRSSPRSPTSHPASNTSLSSSPQAGDVHPEPDSSGTARDIANAGFTNADVTGADTTNVGIALAGSETVARYGSANAEFIKGYRGVDNETGQKLAKGLADIAEHKVNPDPVEAAKNIKQQAGFSAEVAATSRDNAKAIIEHSPVRTVRSDDLPEFGRNHNVVDRVQVLGGEIIEGSQAQMKFVGDRNQLFERIAQEDGKFARYRGVKLELPSEQFEGAQQYCHDKAQALREQATQVEQHGKPDIATKLRREAEHYDQLAGNVRDSGLTTEQAIFYRKHPEIATALDIVRTSHAAGMEGAKYGAVIGGCISLLQNGWAVALGPKGANEAARDLASDTAKAAAIGYGSAFAGSAIKGAMQQSGSQYVRTLSGTNAPALAVTVCISLGSTIKQYVCGEISETQLLVDVGEKGAGLLSSGMMATLGQLAIPVPFLGAAVGGMLGYTLSSIFYQSALDAARGAERSHAQLVRIQAIEAEARARIAQEQSALDAFVQQEIPQLHQQTQQLFSAMELATSDANALAQAVNHYATLMSQQLQFSCVEEFNAFMRTDQPLRL